MYALCRRRPHSKAGPPVHRQYEGVYWGAKTQHGLTRRFGHGFAPGAQKWIC
jgi:hypothetical protein